MYGKKSKKGMRGGKKGNPYLYSSVTSLKPVEK